MNIKTAGGPNVIELELMQGDRREANKIINSLEGYWSEDIDSQGYDDSSTLWMMYITTSDSAEELEAKLREHGLDEFKATDVTDTYWDFDEEDEEEKNAMTRKTANRPDGDLGNGTFDVKMSPETQSVVGAADEFQLTPNELPDGYAGDDEQVTVANLRGAMASLRKRAEDEPMLVGTQTGAADHFLILDLRSMDIQSYDRHTPERERMQAQNEQEYDSGDLLRFDSLEDIEATDLDKSTKQELREAFNQLAGTNIPDFEDESDLDEDSASAELARTMASHRKHAADPTQAELGYDRLMADIKKTKEKMPEFISDPDNHQMDRGGLEARYGADAVQRALDEGHYDLRGAKVIFTEPGRAAGLPGEDPHDWFGRVMSHIMKNAATVGHEDKTFKQGEKVRDRVTGRTGKVTVLNAHVATVEFDDDINPNVRNVFVADLESPTKASLNGLKQAIADHLDEDTEDEDYAEKEALFMSEGMFGYTLDRIINADHGGMTRDPSSVPESVIREVINDLADEEAIRTLDPEEEAERGMLETERTSREPDTPREASYQYFGNPRPSKHAPVQARKRLLAKWEPRSLEDFQEGDRIQARGGSVDYNGTVKSVSPEGGVTVLWDAQGGQPAVERTVMPHPSLEGRFSIETDAPAPDPSLDVLEASIKTSVIDQEQREWIDSAIRAAGGDWESVIGEAVEVVGLDEQEVRDYLDEMVASGVDPVAGPAKTASFDRDNGLAHHEYYGTPALHIMADKQEADDLPLDIFGDGAPPETPGENSISSIAVQHLLDNRPRLLADRSPMVTAACKAFKKVMKKLRAKVTVENVSLQRIASKHVSEFDGQMITGMLHWQVILASHAHRRRASVTLLMPVVAGRPVEAVTMKTSTGAEMPFTSAAVDRVMNVRRQNKSTGRGYSGVPLSHHFEF